MKFSENHHQKKNQIPITHKLNPEYTNDGLHLTGKSYFVWKSAVKEHIGSPTVEK